MDIQNLEVLVADDEPITRKLIEMNLEARAFKVFTARDGVEALQIFGRRPIELVILDLEMPLLNGFDVCTRIRSESDVPIVVLSANARDRARVLAMESGADDFITKPFGMFEFLARIRVVMSRTSTGDELD